MSCAVSACGAFAIWRTAWTFVRRRPGKTGHAGGHERGKILKAEEDPALHALLDEAEYKYADGISMVRSIRRKYPAADVSRVAGPICGKP